MSAPEPVVADSAALLLIGNELLNGKVQDANLLPLARMLRSLGVSLVASSMVRDEPDEIAAEVNRLRASVDVLFTSGGVGPTHDDVTLDAVALAFGVPCVAHTALDQMLRRVYQEKLKDSHLRMARVPQGAQLLEETGVAWPMVRKDNVWILPGIPELFRSKLLIVRTHLRGTRQFCSSWVNLAQDEGELKEHLDAVVAGNPNVEVGSYPRWFDKRYKTRVTFDSETPAAVSTALADLLSRVPSDSVIEIDSGS